MTTSDDVWVHESDVWGLDRLAWEEEDGGPPIDLDESLETWKTGASETPSPCDRPRSALDADDHPGVVSPAEIEMAGPGLAGSTR
jgi:hypothetical protein